MDAREISAKQIAAYKRAGDAALTDGAGLDYHAEHFAIARAYHEQAARHLAVFGEELRPDNDLRIDGIAAHNDAADAHVESLIADADADAEPSMIAAAAAEETPNRRRAEKVRADGRAALATAREQDRHLDAAELLTRCREAARAAVGGTDPDAADDLASILLAKVAERTDPTTGEPQGFTPRNGAVTMPWLIRRAWWLYGNNPHVHTVRDAEIPEPGGTDDAEPMPASLTAREARPDADVTYSADARTVAEGIDADADEQAALAAALGQWGDAAEVAAALGIAYGTARNRISAGKRKLRARFPNPADLLHFLEPDEWDAAAAAYDPTRLTLTMPQRAAAAAIERVSGLRPVLAWSEPVLPALAREHDAWRETRHGERVNGPCGGCYCPLPQSDNWGSRTVSL